MMEINQIELDGKMFEVSEKKLSDFYTEIDKYNINSNNNYNQSNYQFVQLIDDDSVYILSFYHQFHI